MKSRDAKQNDNTTKGGEATYHVLKILSRHDPCDHSLPFATDLFRWRGRPHIIVEFIMCFSSPQCTHGPIHCMPAAEFFGATAIRNDSERSRTQQPTSLTTTERDSEE
jgi:hypothetical protein